jgi:hypothetical protein
VKHIVAFGGGKILKLGDYPRNYLVRFRTHCS